MKRNIHIAFSICFPPVVFMHCTIKMYFQKGHVIQKVFITISRQKIGKPKKLRKKCGVTFCVTQYYTKNSQKCANIQIGQYCRFTILW